MQVGSGSIQTHIAGGVSQSSLVHGRDRQSAIHESPLSRREVIFEVTLGVLCQSFHRPSNYFQWAYYLSVLTAFKWQACMRRHFVQAH
jgi:hypothetical protein